MQLAILHPQLAARSCEHCQRYAYNEKTGAPFAQPDGTLVTRSENNPPPCRPPRAGFKAPGCPKGTPERQLSLTPRNLRIYYHYKRCKITGRWPENEFGEVDGHVARHALLIELATERAERIQAWTAERMLGLRLDHLAETLHALAKSHAM